MHYVKFVLILAMMVFIMVAGTSVMDRMVATLTGTVSVLGVNLVLM